MFMRRFAIVIPILGLTILAAWPPPALAEKKHAAEEKGIKSTNGDVDASIKFVNKSAQTVKIYWLDYDGDRKLYQTLKDGEVYSQGTFLTHPWLITDDNDDAWYVYFPDTQPRTV